MPKLSIGRKGVLKGVFFANITMFLGLFLVVGGFVAVILTFNGMLGWSLQTWQEALVPFVALIGIISFTFMLWLYDKLLGYTFGGKASRSVTVRGLPKFKNSLDFFRRAGRGRMSSGGSGGKNVFEGTKVATTGRGPVQMGFSKAKGFGKDKGQEIK